MVENVFLGLGPGRNAEVMAEMVYARISQKNAGTHRSDGTFKPSATQVRHVTKILFAVVKTSVEHMGKDSAAVSAEKPGVAAAVDQICASMKLQRMQQSGVNEDDQEAGFRSGGAGERVVPLKGAKQPKIVPVAVPAPWVLEHITPILEVRAAVEQVSDPCGSIVKASNLVVLVLNRKWTISV